MKVITFRPFKRLDDLELLNRIYHIYENLRTDKKNYQEHLNMCNELIKEAKYRNLCCSKEMMYHKIIYK